MRGLAHSSDAPIHPPCSTQWGTGDRVTARTQQSLQVRLSHFIADRQGTVTEIAYRGAKPKPWRGSSLLVASQQIGQAPIPVSGREKMYRHSRTPQVRAVKPTATRVQSLEARDDEEVKTDA